MNTKLNISKQSVISNMIMLGYSLDKIERILTSVKGFKSFKDDKVNIIYHKENDDYSIMEY